MKSQPVPVQQVEISKEEVTFWKKEIQASLKRQQEEFITRIGFEELIRYFEGLQVSEASNMKQIAIVDEFSPSILSVITSTYYQNPSVAVEAKNPRADGLIKPQLLYMIQNPDFVPFRLTDLLKASLKYGMDHSGMKEEMQLADFDLLLAGFCAVEMSHAAKPSNQEAQVPDDVLDPSEMNLPDKIMNGLDSLVNKVKDSFSGKSMTQTEVEEKIASEVPQEERIDFTDATYCKRWNPLDILFDARANVFKESRFIGKIVRKTVAEFNVMYPKFKDKVTPGSMQNVTYSAHDALKNKKSVELYEIEIKKNTPRNCILVIADGIDESIDYYEKPVISNNFSIKYGSIDKYGKIYPMSRAKKAKKPQDDINHYMTIQFEHVDRAMRKIGVWMDGLTESGKTAQRSSDPYAIVEKSVPQSVYEVMPAPSTVPENEMLVERMTDSVNKTIGTTQLAKGAQSDNKLLGQDQLEHQAFQVNISGVQDALQDVADQLVDELKDIQQQLWDGEDYFRITGIKGGDQWYTPDMGPLPDVMVGDYLTKTNIISSARPDPVRGKQEAMQLSDLMTNPLTVQFCAMHGKRPSMEVLNNLVKQFDQNPEMTFEDLPPLPPMMPPPGAVPVPVPAGGPPIPGHAPIAPPTQEPMPVGANA